MTALPCQSPPFEYVTGVILAGGRSTRFGRDKVLEPVAGVRLIERVVQVMRPLFAEVRIITNGRADLGDLGCALVPDLVPGLGAVGGLYTALKTLGTEYALVVACDMPCLNPELIRHLVGRREGWQAVVPWVKGYPEPLHSVYRRDCLDSLEVLISAGRYRLNTVLYRLAVCWVDEHDLRRFDPDLLSFLNVNRPNELERILREGGLALSA